ncbi:MAG: phage holin family protein [Pseudonocardiaceae bacterium]|nr:phage holin family protein [Pseudonocardiaceae bacterium]
MTQRDSGQQPAQEVSTAELLDRLSKQVSEVVRDEMALATAELKRKGAKTGLGAGLSGAGGLLALFGIGALVLAAIAGFAVILPAWAASLIVGVLLLVVAGVLTMAGIGQVKKAGPLMPEQAVDSTKRDVETVKESVRR